MWKLQAHPPFPELAQGKKHIGCNPVFIGKTRWLLQMFPQFKSWGSKHLMSFSPCHGVSWRGNYAQKKHLWT